MTASKTTAPQTAAPRSTAGLAALATSQGTFAIVAMDQRNTLKRMYHAAGIADPTDEELVQIKADTVQALRGTASGYLLDPTFGVPALAELPTDGPHYGVLVAAEPSERGTVNGEPRGHRDPSLNARWVKDQGGDALKFYVQLRADRKPGPDGIDTTAEVLEVVRQVVADCQPADACHLTLRWRRRSSAGTGGPAHRGRIINR